MSVWHLELKDDSVVVRIASDSAADVKHQVHLSPGNSVNRMYLHAT